MRVPGVGRGPRGRHRRGRSGARPRSAIGRGATRCWSSAWCPSAPTWCRSTRRCASLGGDPERGRRDAVRRAPHGQAGGPARHPRPCSASTPRCSTGWRARASTRPRCSRRCPVVAARPDAAGPAAVRPGWRRSSGPTPDRRWRWSATRRRRPRGRAAVGPRRGGWPRVVVVPGHPGRSTTARTAPASGRGRPYALRVRPSRRAAGRRGPDRTMAEQVSDRPPPAHGPHDPSADDPRRASSARSAGRAPSTPTGPRGWTATR